MKSLLLSIITDQGMDQVEFNSKETGSLYASNVVLKVTGKMV